MVPSFQTNACWLKMVKVGLSNMVYQNIIILCGESQ